MNKEYKRLFVFLFVFFIIILSFILYLSWPLLTGTRIILATQPVDPVDLFRGQYLNINYEISRVPIIAGILVGDNVYVALKKDDGGIWRYNSSSSSPTFKLSYPAVIIKGEVENIWGGNMIIKYGIEQYFFERYASLDTRNMTVEVKVDSSGKARIVNLLSDGELIKITYSNNLA